MRCIGYLENEKSASTFADFLCVEGIDAHAEADGQHGWAVWVESEDHLAHAGDWLAKFRDNPRDAVFHGKSAQAEALRKQAAREDAEYARKVKAGSKVFRPLALSGMGPVTIGCIAISVVVYLLMLTPAGNAWVRSQLSFSRVLVGMPEILSGQFWRLISPIFLHFGILHIVFNMMWLRDLGGMIELRQGSIRLLTMVVVVGLLSNVAQYFTGPLLFMAAGSTSGAVSHSLMLLAREFGVGAIFGGMSGVNYGLFGYIWIRGRLDPGSGMILHPSTVALMLIWFVLCFTPVLPGIANGAHLAGLAAGMAWGWFSSLRYR